MEDIEQHNIQIMIKMIIDKLHNKTLEEYYTKRSEKQDDKIRGQDKRLEEQDDLLREKGTKIAKLTEEINELRQQLSDKKVGDAEKARLKRQIVDLTKDLQLQKMQVMAATQAITGRKILPETEKKILPETD